MFHINRTIKHNTIFQRLGERKIRVGIWLLNGSVLGIYLQNNVNIFISWVTCLKWWKWQVLSYVCFTASKEKKKILLEKWCFPWRAQQTLALTMPIELEEIQWELSTCAGSSVSKSHLLCSPSLSWVSVCGVMLSPTWRLWLDSWCHLSSVDVWKLPWWSELHPGP